MFQQWKPILHSNNTFTSNSNCNKIAFTSKILHGITEHVFIKNQGGFLLTIKKPDILFPSQERTGFCHGWGKEKQKYGKNYGSMRTKSSNHYSTRLSPFFRHHQLFDQKGFQQANPTRHQSPASVLHSRQLVQMQPFVAGGVPVPSVMPPLFGASGVALQHQPVRSKCKLADNLIPKFQLKYHISKLFMITAHLNVYNTLWFTQHWNIKIKNVIYAYRSYNWMMSQ